MGLRALGYLIELTSPKAGIPGAVPDQRTSKNTTRTVSVEDSGDNAHPKPGVLDRAQQNNQSMTATLEELLSIEVEATEARQLAGRLRFACLPTPASLEGFDYDAAPTSTANSSPNSAPAATWKQRQTSCSSRATSLPDSPSATSRRLCADDGDGGQIGREVDTFIPGALWSPLAGYHI